jgi:hypothetical protein
MIQKVSDNAGVAPVADLTQKTATTKAHRHTPFGDVMVDELATPNVAGIFLGGRSHARMAQATVAATTAQATVAARTAQATVAATTAQATVAATTTQTAVAATRAQAAVAATPAQAAVVTTRAQAAVAATPAPAAAVASTLNAAVAASDSQAADSSSAPTAQSVFGSQPWLATPTGNNPDGTQFGYNPIYFATPQTAQQIAAMVGGQVVEQDAIAANGAMRQQVPNEMIQLSNGRVVNAGLIADFYDHGYPQSYIDMLIQNEIRGA